MSKKTRNLLFIIPIAILAIIIAIPTQPINLGQKSIFTHLGLDLVGGVQVLLEADVPAGTNITADAMNTSRTIISNRANGMLGVGEAVVQQVGDRRISVELPGETDPAAAIAVLGETGQLEFVDMGNISQDTARTLVGQTLVTDYPVVPPDTAADTPVYHTVMTGTALKQVNVLQDRGENVIAFTLDADGAKQFREYTSANVGNYLAIVLDKQVISIPVVKVPITNGEGSISGNFTPEEAGDLAVQLRYGALPVPLIVVNSRTVGPSLGQDSLTQSLIAGLVGFGLVVLFMAGYYRLPGIIADLALIVYVAITIALFKLIPVTMTLPGIAGFVLSIGVAVDANVLIFERMKEELRAGRSLIHAIDLGWDRAWPSIRDSNISTLITCSILFWFGNAFGASVVKGFAVTLALGVGVSLFTAIVVTRSFLHLFLDKIGLSDHRRWFAV
ncbi:MAG TPA: protein translocase subunit SecD [Chloroflexi bacterium]|nr:protein translocase subunit SecD [Chloroflexota bacterium]HBY06469.1 protein translocase subunit SecD [Chloroflexota bacterium]